MFSRPLPCSHPFLFSKRYLLAGLTKEVSAMNGIDLFLIRYGLLAVFLLLLLKTSGVPVPVPSDLIILTVAARVAQGKLAGWQTFLAILFALVLGGLVQFAVARGLGRGLLDRFGRCGADHSSR
jgi:membrane protein DedA with SNARE-associated domain